MPKINHAAADAGEHEGETIEVDLSAKDGEQVTRRQARSAPTPKDRGNGFDAAEWEQKNRHVKKRLAQQARAYNQQRAEDQAEFNRQLALRDERLAKLERGGETVNTDEAAHQKVMDQFEESIAAAQEEGDSRKVARLTREMTQADTKFWAAVTAKQVGGGGGKGNETGAGAGGGTTTVKQPTTLQPTKAGVAWAKANAEWFDDPSDRTHVAARAFANALYKDKTDDGDDRDDPEFYEEIRQEVKKRFPEIETVSTMSRRSELGDDDELDDDDVTTEERDQAARDKRRRERETRPPARARSLSLPNRGEPDRLTRNRNATITGAEQRAMRAVNLDPSNNKHVLQWIESRNAMEADA